MDGCSLMPPAISPTTHRVRYRPDIGWEMRCDDCVARGRSGSFWPLLPEGEFWAGRHLTRCVACERERIATKRRRTPHLRRDRRTEAAKAKLRYYLDREGACARSRAYYYANRERILA